MRRFIKCGTALLCALLLAVLPLTATAAPIGGGQASPSGTIKHYGCDVSFWNVGGYYPDYARVDFEKMKADGCGFVILRMGFEGTASRENALDSAFLTLYENAKQAGLGVGVYFYALATTYEGAAEDAAWCIDIFEQYDMSFEYPIYYDVEDPGNGADRLGHYVLTDTQMTQLCLGWAETLEAAGYFPGVYGTHETLTKLLPAYTDVYDIWLAYVAYEEETPEFIPEEQDHSYFCGMWQYSWVGSFDGVVGDLDVNVAYKDYPTIMKQNGYNNMVPEWGTSPSVMIEQSRFIPYDYNGLGEGISPTYNSDSSVTLTNTVSTASWSWPSAYMVCKNYVDITRYPLLTVQKSGTAHFNAVLQYMTPSGSTATLNLASLDGQSSGEFDSGDMTITVDVQTALRNLGHLPQNGILGVVGVTYFIMGLKNSYVTVHSATFAESPIPDELTSSYYTIDGDFITGVQAPTTVATLLNRLDNANGVVVRSASGTVASNGHTVATGMTVAIEKGDTVMKSYTVVVGGDVNGDGVRTPLDARAALISIVSEGDALAACQILAADYDRNGIITTADARRMLLAIAAT